MKIADTSCQERQFNSISYDEVRRLFDYDWVTGKLIWKVKPSKNIHKGSVVNGGVKCGYSKVGINGVRYKTHRIVWIWHNGYDSEHFIDHIDKDKLNNSIENLREVNKQCNMRNSSVRLTTKTGIKGVYPAHGKDGLFVAQIIVNGRATYLGRSSDIVEVACHRLAAEQCLGWLDCDKDSSAYNFVIGAINGGCL